ncbi:hypothetical protein RJ641_011468 [Dillenia turbinata]|uniref:Uncharacterized protein n=1 Tax=Dillenia turbinata TaxID=194707 RepID=A0AAN8V1I5_9MAGN
MRCLKAPIRILVKARDFYVKSMTDCAERVSYGSIMGCPTGQTSTSLPRSFSVNSTKSMRQDDDLRELIRAASTRSLGNRVDLDLQGQLKSPRNRGGYYGKNKDWVMPRSLSVGIGKIDEDKPCEFGDDVNVKVDLFKRSRSCAVTKRYRMF